MILFDENGQSYNTSELQILSRIGTTAVVYMVDSDKILKVAINPLYIKKDVKTISHILKNGDYSCFIKILSEMKYDNQLYGYLSKRYYDENYLLFLPIDTLLEAIANLEKEVETLSKKNILIYDASTEDNFFIVNNQFMIVDIWDFHIVDSSKQNIITNREILIELILSALIKECENAYLREFIISTTEKIDKEKPLQTQYKKYLRNIDTNLYTHFK